MNIKPGDLINIENGRTEVLYRNLEVLGTMPEDSTVVVKVPGLGQCHFQLQDTAFSRWDEATRTLYTSW